jgi:DNA replication protein DnaC
VLFARTSDLVQKLQVARRELALEAALASLERFDLLILDDITYVTKDQAETSVLFELNVESYRRRAALERKQHGAVRPAAYATPTNVGVPAPRDNPLEM